MNGHDTTFLCWTRPLVYTKSALNGPKTNTKPRGATNGRPNKDHLCKIRYTRHEVAAHAQWARPAGQSSLSSIRIPAPAQLRQNLPILLAYLDLLQQVRPV